MTKRVWGFILHELVYDKWGIIQDHHILLKLFSLFLLLPMEAGFFFIDLKPWLVSPKVFWLLLQSCWLYWFILALVLTFISKS